MRTWGLVGRGRPLTCLPVLTILSIWLSFPVPAQAQVLDPKLLESLQGQLGSGQSGIDGQSSTSSPFGSESLLNTPVPGARIDTSEEQEVRRALARLQLRDLYEPSLVELDYRRRLNEPQLRQFGYDFFQSAPAPTGTRTGAIGDDYILGVGDEMQVSFRGATNRTYTVRVDRDGRVVVGDLRPVQAAGRSLGGVRGELEAETRRTLLATDVFVSVGEVRAISVFVGGEVARPGQFSLTSLSDIGTALAQAGGVRRSGSLRQVRLVRAGGGTVTVDLYGLLGIGTPSSVRLRDGDRVIVPVIGPTVAVTGSVARAGIYELRGPASVGAVVAFAGGAIRQRGAQVVISRIEQDGTESFVRAPSASSTVTGGDAVQVVGGSPGGAVGRVQLAGHVDNRGARPLVAAGTVAELVGSAESLRPDSYRLAAVLLRRDPTTGARVFDVVNLARELMDGRSTPLQSEDRLFIFSRGDIQFMNSVEVRQIILGQPNPLPECLSLRRLALLVKDTESSRFNAVTRGNFVVVTSQGAELGNVGTQLGQGGGRMQDVEADRRGSPLDPAQLRQAELRGQPPQNGQDGLDQAAAREAGFGTRGRFGDGVDDNPVCPTVFEEEPDLLPVLIEHSVSVGGAVRRPGAYPVGARVTARDLSLMADGLVTGASDLVLDINRARLGPPERVQADGSGSMLAITQLGAGDDIRFNAQQPVFEGSAILLAGEVARPGLYAIRKGERLSELLSRAGGLTEYAYAYGTVFTRRSVKDSQEEGFRRTAREMNNSLLAIAARSPNAGGITGAAQLIAALSQAEGAGRMVVEADPRVLELRPDLDTILEPGDSITVPKRPNFVLALGDVNNPGALQFVEGKSANLYLSEAGGLLPSADDDRVFVVLPNGTTQPVRGGGWGGGGGSTPPPGSTIIVPKNIDPLFRLTVIRDITTIIAQLATSIATVAVLATR